MQFVLSTVVMLLLLFSTSAHGEETWSSFDLSTLSDLESMSQPLPDTVRFERYQHLSKSLKKNDSFKDKLERLRPRWHLVDTDDFKATISLTEDKREFIIFIIRF